MDYLVLFQDRPAHRTLSTDCTDITTPWGDINNNIWRTIPGSPPYLENLAHLEHIEFYHLLFQVFTISGICSKVGENQLF